MALGQNFLSWFDRVSHPCIWKISPKTPNFSIFFPFGSKISYWVGSKNTQAGPLFTADQKDTRVGSGPSLELLDIKNELTFFGRAKIFCFVICGFWTKKFCNGCWMWKYDCFKWKIISRFRKFFRSLCFLQPFVGSDKLSLCELTKAPGMHRSSFALCNKCFFHLSTLMGHPAWAICRNPGKLQFYHNFEPGQVRFIFCCSGWVRSGQTSLV